MEEEIRQGGLHYLHNFSCFKHIHSYNRTNFTLGTFKIQIFINKCMRFSNTNMLYGTIRLKNLSFH